MLTRRKGYLTPKAREVAERQAEEKLAEVGRRFYEEGRKSRDRLGTPQAA